MQYTEKTFNLPELSGLSAKQLEVHLKLYAGYVKNVNLMLEKIAAWKEDSATNALALSEIKRRFGFEFNGMRLHELYFEALGGDGTLADGKLKTALETQYGSIDAFKAELKALGLMRGIGWVLLVEDKSANTFHTVWVSDHEVGHLATTNIVLAMDMWEHAFMVDYVPADKGQYIDAFLNNVNWSVVESRL